MQKYDQKVCLQIDSDPKHYGKLQEKGGIVNKRGFGNKSSCQLFMWASNMLAV